MLLVAGGGGIRYLLYARRAAIVGGYSVADKLLTTYCTHTSCSFFLADGKLKKSDVEDIAKLSSSVRVRPKCYGQRG